METSQKYITKVKQTINYFFIKFNQDSVNFILRAYINDFKKTKTLIKKTVI